MNSSILIPTDFSENAWNAFKYALELSSVSNTEYHFLNTYMTPNARAGGMMVSLDEVLLKESEREMEKLLSKARLLYPEIHVEGHCLRGDLIEGIERGLISSKASLIVMGTQGASGLKEVLIGSNAEKVIREATAPVITVPEDAELFEVNHIVFASNFQPLQNPNSLGMLSELARKFEAEVTILHISDNPEHIDIDSEIKKAGYDDALNGIAVKYHTLKSDDIERTIDAYMREEHGDLLALVPRKANFFQSLFRKSVTKACVYHTKSPILAMHDIK